MPKVVIQNLPTFGCSDPKAPCDDPLGAFTGRAISTHHEMNHLGANIETLEPGASSSHRHWHDSIDEMVVVLTGVLILHDETGHTPLRAGDIAVFPAGDENGHCLINTTDAPAAFLVVGSHDAQDRCFYVDIDRIRQPDGTFTRRDGSIVDP